VSEPGPPRRTRLAHPPRFIGLRYNGGVTYDEPDTSAMAEAPAAREPGMRVTLATDPGTPGWPNEDFAAVAPGAAVLLDGATTNPRSADTGCVHGVAWFARTLGTTFLALLTAGPATPLSQALAEAISDVRARHEGTCDLSHRATPAATVTAVRAAGDGIDYLALSDSSVAADPAGDGPPVIITDTHPAASASPDAARLARTGTLPRAGLRGVALLSDGATRITDRYGVLSWAATIGVVREDGPAGLIRRVRAAEDGDPDGARWPRRKIRDDATIVYWRQD
jgi:Protein phosphatase 2C